MLKQLLSILLILALMLPAAALGEEASAALPNIGDTVEGFIAIDVRDFPLVGGTAVLFEHDQTGAKLMYLANDDTNRTFDLTFRTQAIDNTGLPHVFEHSTLDGSEKYPSKALFFNLAAQTYNTFMNAMTYPHMTTYPIASLSEKQLLKYADYYTDSCLHPTIMQDESIYREEAWRYRLASMDDALTIEGTVYSEMLGALTLESMANANISRAAFPGSIAGNISGGDPAYIPDMTYEALCAYHNMYYHPSNCMAFLYGQFEDYTAFLKLLNDAFSGFEKREFSFEDPDYTPIEAPVEEVYDFPVEASSDPSNASVVYYAFVCPGLRENPEQELLLNTLTDLMTADASPMAQSIRRAIPTGSFASYIDTIGPEDAIIFEISNVEPEDAATFRDTVQEGLRQIAEDGFPQELVDGVMASLNLAVKLAREGNDVGVELICNIAYSALASGDPFDYMNYVDALNLLDDWNAQGLYAKAVSDWLLNSQTTALATTRPLPGLKEQNDAALAERLQSVKAEMDEETLQALIDQTNATAEEEDTSAYVSQLQAVSVDSLPEEIKLYPIVDEVGEDTVRRMSAEAAVEDVGRPVLWLDASGIAQEELHWFRLYLSMLGELDTRAHTREELATLMTRYLSGSETRVSITGKGDDYHPWLRAGWISMEDDLPQGYDLMYELLFDTDFTDASRLAEVLDQTQASLKSSIKQSPYTAGLYRGAGHSNALYRYYDYMNLLPYYGFLSDAKALLEADAEAFIAHLTNVQEALRNRTNAVSAYAGSSEGIAVNRPLADAFLARLDAREIAPVQYDLPVPAQSEGIVIDGGAQYNGYVASLEEAGLSAYDGGMDAITGLVYDAFLIPLLRDQYGAYGILHGIDEDLGVYLLSYRDPNVRETFDVYDTLAERLATMSVDQDTLDGYILSTYAGYALSSGELTGAVSALANTLDGRTQQETLERMHELKQVTPEAVQAFAPVYAKLVENGYKVTVGTAAAIQENADLYAAILNPLGAQDATQIELEDLPQDHPSYEAVRFVFENGLMLPVSESAFGVDEAATAGDLAGALYAVIGGDAEAQQEALDTLAEYEIIPAGMQTDEALTAVQTDRLLANFSEAIGLEYALDDTLADEPLTRAGLAEVLAAYMEALG